MLVSTTNAKRAHTAIRVGNSGLEPAFAELKQSCNHHVAAKQAHLQPNAH
jgi:hypothetical protein